MMIVMIVMMVMLDYDDYAGDDCENYIHRQSLLSNIVKEVLNGLTRIVGWGLTTLVR